MANELLLEQGNKSQIVEVQPHLYVEHLFENQFLTSFHQRLPSDRELC